MEITWPNIQCLINITSILGIWVKNCLITPMYVELMGRRKNPREVDDTQCLNASMPYQIKTSFSSATCSEYGG